MPETTSAPAPGEVSDASSPSEPQAQALDLSSSRSSLDSGSSQPAQNGASQSEATEDKKPKPLSRYERTKRQRAALAQREAQIRAREEQIAQAERARTAPKKPDYTIAELRQYRKNWQDEAKKLDWDPEEQALKLDLVEKADKEIARLEQLEQQEQGQQSFTNEWRTAEAELYQADPEFLRSGTRLDTKLREIMGGQDGNIYRQHPRGIVAAYHRARMELLEGDFKSVTGENQQLKAELKRLTGLTSIGGGVPGRIGGNRIENINDFSKLSSADMRKHLRSTSGKDAMPWI
jgi:hypothetical protein